MTKNSRIAAIGCLFALGAVPTFASEKCYDFDKLAVGTRWGADEQIDFDAGKVIVRRLLNNGVPMTPENEDAQFLKVSQSQIAGDTAPELAMSLVTMQIVPTEPVQEVYFKLAQQLGATGNLPAYLGVNFETHELRGSFAQSDGTTLGSPLLGEARLTVQLTPDPPPSYWTRGWIRVRATSGDIKTFSIGSQIAHFGKVCLRR